MNTQDYWEKVYRESNPTTDVSWYQAHPTKSLELISLAGLPQGAPLIDVGGGASLLVDCLLKTGFKNISVLDISESALQYARNRLGSQAPAVQWLHANVTQFEPKQRYALWHDRAVFHFLTGADDRANYVQGLRRALLPEGHLILGTFAEDGPARCSGLPVVRYGVKSITAELGSEFSLVDQQNETHVTPWATEQRFCWFYFRYYPARSTPSLAARSTDPGSQGV
jgi:ubiquinone/menaquinone biosynthesis C-methylase UbiE